MDIYTNSSGGLQHVVGYGSHSVVLSHHPTSNHCHYHTVSSQPLTKSTSAYQLVPILPVERTTVYVPIQQTQQQQPKQQRQTRQSQVTYDPFRAEQYLPSRGTSAKIPRYNSLDDPHMQDYYARKFGNRPKSATRHSVRTEALYKITVKTADKKDAGTNAKVYLTIHGSKGKLCRKLLTRETMLRGHTQLSASLNGLNRITDNDIYNIEFKRGATDVIYIRHRDLGIISSIILEHAGLLMEQSWLCEFIMITNVRNGRSWFFPCNQWLSAYPPGDGLAVELFPNDQTLRDKPKRRKSAPETTEYEINVVTGDKRGAGTDSQVYITVFGEDGQRTEKLHLKKPLNNKNPFERNQTDTFRIKGDYVGDLAKLRIEHDNTGRLAGWFLDRIVITDLYEPETKYFATCNKWLAKDEGDGQISRDLVLNKNKAGGRGSNQYKIIVFTGKKRGGGTDADVSITLFGDLGESGAIILDDKKNNFESGQKDEFKIECPSVGEINKILIGHNNKGTGPGWFLDRVLVEDLNANRIYEFPCNRWLATDEDDGQISRFLYPKKGDGSTPMPTEGVPYNITVYTANKSNAGTDARIYIIMHNKKSTSGQIFLPNGKFEQSSVDLCQIQAPDELSPLTALDIGHDNSGRGPGWFLDKVVVDCPSTGIKQTFPCNRWLAEDEDDHKIERRLKEDLSLREQRPPTIPWYIWVYTSDIKGAGTDAEVKLVLYGHDGKSDDIKLKSKSDAFEAGKCDEFKVDVTDVGKPYKLRVSHDNKKAFAAWHLDRIEMENLKTNKRYVFRCGRWLSKDDDDKQIIRELPAEGPEIKRPLPVTKYMVDVYTGGKSSAGTNANVFVNIFGECGDTGERPLEYSKNRDKFEKNQMDSFVIEAVLLKNIQKIRIGHDGSGPGAGWFLNKVVVRPEDPRYEPVTFECNRWLAVDEDDGKIVRELTSNTATQHLDKTTYNIQIKTGDVFGAGTDADVHLKIFGEKGDSDKITLRTSDNTKNKFERNQTDKFTYEFDDLGKIKSILIGHNGKKPGAGWFLDWVDIDIPMRGEVYRFACHRWLDKNEDDGQIELNLTPSDVTRRSSVIPYEVTVFTGDKSGAGTDAKVFIQMYGLNGKTEEIILKSKSDTFEQKAVDKFKIEAPDIGQIQKIRIGHNSAGFGSAWYLEKVLIQRHLNEPNDKRKKSFKNVGSQRLSQISATDPNVEEYWFVCRQWFDKSSGDRQTVRELLPTDADGKVLSREKEVTYTVHVFTGNKRGAGTDSNVFLIIYGEKADSGERELKKSNNRNKFEQNQEDVFEIKAISLGKLRKIKIRHDNAGAGSAWFLDRVEIVDSETEQVYHFICQKWLAVNEDDGMISREIPALENKALRLASARESISGTSSMDYNLEMKALATTYKVNVITSSKVGSGTNANVYIIIFGRSDDTGKVPLMTSKTHNDPFEHGHTDVFEIEAMDIGEPKKIKIGHDNSGFLSDWLLERVEIDVPKMGRSWIFPCGKWISKSKGDRELEVELYPQEKATEIYEPHIPYEIKIFTSNLSGAGTDANVFIEIYGEEKTTGQITLCSKTERKGKFQTGSTDVFVPELEDVGEEITKIRIGHDNSGFGAAWHLDRVEIRRLLDNQKTSTYVFPCNRWFAKNEDDRQIVRELVPEKVIEEKLTKGGQLKVKEKDVRDRLDMKQYTVDVYTADKLGAGTDANVFCTVFGDKGDSGERELAKSETHTDKFERKHMDRFKIDCADLGNIYKLKIRHDNKGIMNADWLLERVEVLDDIKSYVFHCEQWLSKSKGDKKIERTLYEKDYQGSMTSVGSVPRSIGGSKASLTSVDSKNEPFRAGQRKNLMTSIAEAEESRDQTGNTIPYTVKIKTGEASDAGTSANAYIRLIGQRGEKTNLIPLKLMQRKRFEPGNVDTFSIQATDIGQLDVVEIEHDGQTDNDSWFIDDIRIEMPTEGRAFFFDCHQWLAKNKGDGRTKRRLKVQESNQSSFRPLIPYEVTFYTGDVDHAGCDCDVGLKIFGVNGSSSEHIIRKDEGNFERGKIDRFQIELDDVGKPSKIRARIIPKSKKGRNKWFLEKIELVKQGKPNERVRSYFFGLMDWISSDTDNFRDLPISKDGQALIKQTTYRIVTKTSDIDGAGCDSNVFVTLFGETGDSGELELKHSTKHRNKFERNHDDEFLFENILSLGELTKLRIRHDDSAFMKSSWHLEYVEVEDTQTGQHYTFPCNKWLSSKKDDKQIVRELVCDENSANTSRRGSITPGGKIFYEIAVTTSDKRDAGTSQNGWIILVGKKKRSERFYLKNTAQNKILRNGKTDRFTFECRPLGELSRIIVGHEERRDYPLDSHEDRQAFWHVSQILVTDTSTGTKYEFPIRKWIEINNDGDEFDCKNKEEDNVSKQRHRQTINYKIVVHTGDVSAAGTDANVSIILYGTLGDTGKRELKQKGRNLFERNQVDEFIIECLDLGELEKLHIEHDNSGLFNADWFLDKVEVINMETDEKILFPCNQWLGQKHGDHEIQRDLLPIHAS